MEIYSARMKGFTLIEILIAAAIFSIIMLTLFSSFRSFIVSYSLVRDNLAASEISGSIINILERDFLQLRIPLFPEYSKPDGKSNTLSPYNQDNKDKFQIAGEEINKKGLIFSTIRFASLNHIQIGSALRSSDFGAANFGAGGFDGTNDNNKIAADNKIIEAGAARIFYYVRSTSDSEIFNSDSDNKAYNKTDNGENKFELCRSDALNSFDEPEENSCDPVICRNIIKFKITYIDEQGEEYSHWDSESDEFNYSTPVAIFIELEFKVQDSNSIYKLSKLISMPVFRPPIK